MADKKINGWVEITGNFKAENLNSGATISVTDAVYLEDWTEIHGNLLFKTNGSNLNEGALVAPSTSGWATNKTIATLDDIQAISGGSNYVQVGNVNQSIDGRKTFVNYPYISGISRSAKTADDGKVAGFIYNASGSSVTSEGHFIAYGTDDTSDGSKPTANWTSGDGTPCALYYNSGVSLYDTTANGAGCISKIAFPKVGSSGGTFVTRVNSTAPDATGNVSINIPTSFDLTDDILDGSANKYAPYSSRGAGHLYTGSTAPSSTNRLNYDGYFYATKLYSGGAEVKTTDNNYYPTAMSWTNGTTSGPTAYITMLGTSNISVGAIPAANGTTRSGIVTTGNQTFGGEKTFSSKVTAPSFYATSDKRLKENLIEYAPSKSILELPIYKFDFIDGAKNQIGCLAQDLQEICPEIVQENSSGFLTIQESKIVYLLIDEIKKLKLKIEKLENKDA